MTRTQIINWCNYHRNNILKSMSDGSLVPLVGRTYVFKTALGIKFFLVQRYLTSILNTKISETSYLFKPDLNLKLEFKIEEIYVIGYNSHDCTLIYIYAKDVNSGCYDTYCGLAIDITKIPQYTVGGGECDFNFYDSNIEILTLEELFVYKDNYEKF